MNAVALVTSAASLPDDFDMPLLVAACRRRGVRVEVCRWDDPDVDWRRFAAVVLRSPWDYVDRLGEFLAWCDMVTAATDLRNPMPVIRWSLDKHYLADLARHGVPIVPSTFVEPGSDPEEAIKAYFADDPDMTTIVVKPTIGCYSRDVRRFNRTEREAAARHLGALLRTGAALIQPYLDAVDGYGETNLVYFEGAYSHAIRKEALLSADGTVSVPTFDFRSSRDADASERAVAEAALEATRTLHRLERPLLYARIDLIRDDTGQPRLLELEIAEPSLSLPLCEVGAERFADALGRLSFISEEV